MTRKQAIWLTVIGVAAGAGLVVLHLNLPIAADWRTNRLLHYVWQVAAGLAAVGGIVWALWPRPKAARRDLDRANARRRVLAVAVLAVGAVGLVVFAEIRRERDTGGQLADLVREDLVAIGQALQRYAADHNGAQPKDLEELVPQYLDAGRLYYAWRNGPFKSDPPAAGADGKPAEPPSYALAREPPVAPGRKVIENRFVAYLRPGHAWAPLTGVLEKDGKVQVISEDMVGRFERQREQK